MPASSMDRATQEERVGWGRDVESGFPRALMLVLVVVGAAHGDGEGGVGDSWWQWIPVVEGDGGG
jgi:hypothetical protein